MKKNPSNKDCAEVRPIDRDIAAIKDKIAELKQNQKDLLKQALEHNEKLFGPIKKPKA